MANNNTSVAFLLDMTGSMEQIKTEAISGFNEYINKLKKDANNVNFTFTTFNSGELKVHYIDKNINEVKELTTEVYKPDHTTPLYDAVGRTINSVNEKLNKLTEKPKVLIVILTDGLENASQEYTVEGIKQLIKEKEKEDWNFVFMGAGKDTWLNAKQMGIDKGNTFIFSSKDLKKSMYRAGGCSTAFAQSSNRRATNFWGK